MITSGQNDTAWRAVQVAVCRLELVGQAAMSAAGPGDLKVFMQPLAQQSQDTAHAQNIFCCDC